jgi:hypothetical protein
MSNKFHFAFDFYSFWSGTAQVGSVMAETRRESERKVP